MQLAGRDRETEAIADALAASRSSSRSLTVVAPAGVGKTALLDQAVRNAECMGVRVLRCRPTAAEQSLGYVALADLLEPITDLDAVPDVSRRALEAALLRAPAAEAVDTRAVGAACAALWCALADAPLLICADDLQWVDPATIAALRFSWRRLPAHNVFVLAARRSDAGSDDDADGRMTVENETSIRMSLEPLDDGAILQILSNRAKATGERFSQSARRAIVAAAAGNPLYAVELANHVDGHNDGRGPLHVPPTLTALLEQRWGRVPAAVTDALGALALASRPDIALARRLGVLGDVEVAEREGFVDTHDREIRFSHPLVAASLVDRSTPTQVRRWHRALAGSVDDPTERIRHAALGADEPDDDLASLLSVAAQAAIARSTNDYAADLARLAVRVGQVDAPERTERLLAAAHLAFQCGDTDAAVAWFDELDQTDPERTPTAHELLVRARVDFSVVGGTRPATLALAALEVCTTDAERVDAHALLARVMYDDFPTAARHAAIAFEIAERASVPPAVLASALVARAGTACMAGEGLDRRYYDRAIELERGNVSYAGDSAYASLAALLKMADELDEARRMFLVVLADHDEGALPYALSHLPQLELWSGNWDAAEDYAHRHLDAAIRLDQSDQVAQARTNLSMIDAFRGNTAAAAEIGGNQVTTGRDAGDAWTERSGHGMLGFVALAEGDAERAVTMFAEWERLGNDMGLGEPGYSRFRGDHVEALLAAGRVEDAAEHADAMQSDAVRLERVSLLSGAARVSALVAATRLDRDAAVELGRVAVELSMRTPLVVEQARAMLSLGQIHRRFKEKSAARDALQEALAVFERLGAERFAERARQDLARIGLRPSRGPGLTSTERQVALLAATGRTVRQVGDELFISPKTVEANLTRVYRKLALSGRAELALWAERESVS